MKIDITDLKSIENQIEEHEVTAGFSSFRSRMGEFPITKKEPFLLHLEHKENQSLAVCGKTKITILVPCDRCLKETAVQIPVAIRREFLLKESESEEADGDMEYLEGTELDVDALIYDEILTGFPMKVLCREDCKGICRTCGINLNDKTCSCDKTDLDPRMAAIQDIFHQFKEV